jgi:hypothetical protein
MNARATAAAGTGIEPDDFVDYFKGLREHQLAERPCNAAGSPVCGCGALLGPDEVECAVCPERRRVAERERALCDEIRAGLLNPRKTIPPWAWADVDNPLYFERVQAPRLRAAAQRWTPEGGPLLLLGPSGIGKTSTAIAIAHRLISAAESVARHVGSTRCAAFQLAARIRWISALELARARRNHPLGRGECGEWTEASRARLLVLDELGQEQADPRWLLELLDARYARSTEGFVTLSTSGLTHDALLARYGSGAWRKLAEPDGTIVDLFGGSGGG